MKPHVLRRYAYAVICLIGLVVLLYVGVRFLLPPLLPFLLAWGTVQLTRPLAQLLHRKLRLPLRLSRTLTALLSLLLLCGGLFALTFYLGSEAWRWLSEALAGEELGRVLGFLLDPLGQLTFAPSLTALKEQLSEAIYTALGGVLGSLTSWLSATLSSVPQLVLFFTVTLVATVYVAWDLERVNRTVLSLLPARARTHVLSFKRRFLLGVWPYVRAYLILMLMTFAVMTVGLSVLGVEYALLVAVIIALLDPLPVIGVGTVLIPWSLFHLFFGETSFGVGLLILYVAHEILRQIAEPRILGRSMGLHPLVTLLLLYAGYTFFGFAGLLLLPLLTVTLHVLLGTRGAAKGEADAAPSREKEKTVGHEGSDAHG